MPRKEIATSTNHLASILAKSEVGLSQANIGDIRQILKILVSIEAAGYLKQRKSIFAALRREAIAKAVKAKKK